MLVLLKMGASSCCAGATSLCSVLGQDSQFPQLFVQIFHERGDPWLDSSEIVILHLLPLGRFCAEQCAAGQHQVFPLKEEVAVHQEILLLRAHGGGHTLHIGVAEESQNSQRLPV